MPIALTWYLPDAVLHWSQSASTTDDELRAASEQVILHIEASAQPLVHLLMDASEVRLNTMRTNALEIGSLASFYRHPRLGLTVFYGNPNPRYYEMLNMLLRTLHVHFAVATDRPAAVQTLRQHYPQLPPMPDEPIP